MSYYTETALGLNLLMQQVEGSTYVMGSNEGDDSEKPTHKVTLKDFYIGVYAVTQAQWEAVMGNNSYFKGNNYPAYRVNWDDYCKGGNYPVDNISWNDVQLFLQKLNEQTTKHYRLPTESEWEYAARGGKQSKGYSYAGSHNINEVAWHINNSGDTIHSIEEQKKPNELGLYDMSGNVWEWCQDKWHDNYIDASTNGTAWESGTSDYRVLRGGACSNHPHYCRVTYREYGTPDVRMLHIGFRLVASIL